MVQLTADKIDKLIGKRIQMKRKEQGYSAEKLSEYIGISQQQLSRYERGTNKINVAHLVKIARFLQQPISWFFLDCMPIHENMEKPEDKYWTNMSEHQKQMFINFFNAIKNP